MKLRVSIVRYADDVHRFAHDITLTFDATATVGEAARALVRGGAGHPQLLPFSVHRQAPMTLKMTQPGGNALILDPADRVARSGLKSGSVVEPVLESHPGDGRRVRPPVASLTVMNGAQRQVVFLATDGETTVGRDRLNRVELHDPGVSRRHAILRRVDDAIEIVDLGSANGTGVVNSQGERLESREEPAGIIRLRHSALVEFGTVTVRIEIGPPPEPPLSLDSAVSYLQSPQVDPVYAPEPVELPAPPDEPEPTRFPLIAMVAPLLMGGVLYLMTQSMMSLVFIALSPLIMIGSWFDNRLTRRKTSKTKQREFEANLTATRRELEANVPREQAARERETPAASALATLPSSRGLQLWSRRPEHRAFLELRLGTASLPSRKEIKLPPRSKISAEQWDELTRLHGRFADVSEVPLLERLERCGSLGIAGHPDWASASARAILLQLVALHSPADVVFTAFANHTQASGEWSWLKWLPHVDSAYSPLPVAHLAADERSASMLLTALEGLIADRAGASGTGTVRSRVVGAATDAKERLTPADGRPAHPAVVVVVLADTLVDRTRLVGLAEDGADVGVHVIWVAQHLGSVPAACRTVVEAYTDVWRAHFVRQGELIELGSLDGVELPAAQTFARELAPFVDAGARVLDESDLPRSVGLAQIVSTDILGSSDSIVKNWHDTDSLFSGWHEGKEREASQLAAIVGQGSAGPVEIDLRTHGPHALVGGTTGSGKSEFLQTWILSLAANYAPDRLTFLLVDYKGGAAFADCVDLPHTVGLVTDLNTHLVRRALTSLRAELRYREELLAEKGAKDLVALERRGDPEAPPALVIVIDEFAALVSEIPDFVDGVIDVAQRGRSLGLHLVMATQRPAGVIKDNLRANTNLRVALRMADPADSSDVIGVTDAAGFSPEVPGRAAIKVGAGRLAHLQTGYLGGRAETEHQEAVEVRDLGFGEQAPWNLLPEVRRLPDRVSKGARDIETLAANIRSAAVVSGTRAPRRPWVDQLPEQLPLSSDLLTHALPQRSRATAEGITVGLIDEPHLQRRSPYAISLAETGNLALFGGVGSGKTTTLMTLAAAAVNLDSATQVYGIDCAGGRLSVLAQLPRVGDIVPGDERDRIIRVLRLLKGVIADRSTSSPSRDSTRPFPKVLLLLDGLSAFRDAHEHRGGGADPFADLIEIAASGRTVGVHVILTSERSNGMPASLASSFPERLAIKLTAESDYLTLGVPSEALEGSGPGRAIRIGAGDELQLALPGASSDPADTDTAIAELAEQLTAQGAPTPTAVPAIPESIRRTAIPKSTGRAAPFALDTEHLAPVAVPNEGFLLVTGPAGSGRSTAIRSILAAIREDARTDDTPVGAVLISPRRSAQRTSFEWQEIADSADSREDVIERLTRSLGGIPSKAAGLTLLPLIGTEPEASPEDHLTSEPTNFPSPGSRGVVVIEDIGGFDGTGNEQALGSLLKLLRRSELTTIVEGENATLGTVWELVSPLRGARWAIALQPDANDTPSIFTTPFTHAKRAEYPPGRGFLVEGGRLRGVHVGLEDSPDPTSIR